MKRITVVTLLLMSLLLTLMTPALTHAQTTDLQSDFTYQGFLSNAGGAVNASCNFQFSLFDATLNGNQIGSTQQISAVAVTNGAFSVQLDFGAGVFNGQDRFLEIEVQCPGDTGFMTLTPRQPITPAPYAGYALGVPWTGISGVPIGFADSVDNLGDDWNNLTNVPDDFADNVDNEGWGLTGNAGTTPGTNFIGTTDNVALEFFVNSLRALRIEPADDSVYSGINVIGGYSGNTVDPGVVGATILGGGQLSDGSTTYPNSVSGDFGTIGGGDGNIVSAVDSTVSGGYDNTASAYGTTVGGGYSNEASGEAATVSGGESNIASGFAAIVGGAGNTASGDNATVSGGDNNTASGNYATVGGGQGNIATGQDTTVAGGYSNAASGNYATVDGGWDNTASGDYATVGGGRSNRAAGAYSFVAGRQAYNGTGHDGVFLFADNTLANFASLASNEFAARASGGVRLRTSSDLTTGCDLAAGSGTWSCTSSREAKNGFEAVDAQGVLNAVASVPITTWRYNNTDTLHMGPVAEDFYAAFGLGEGETTISTVDADGVALAAIQGLYEVVQEKDSQISALESRLNGLEQQNTVVLSVVMVLMSAMIAAGLYFGQRHRQRGTS